MLGKGLRGPSNSQEANHKVPERSHSQLRPVFSPFFIIHSVGVLSRKELTVSGSKTQELLPVEDNPYCLERIQNQTQHQVDASTAEYR